MRILSYLYKFLIFLPKNIAFKDSLCYGSVDNIRNIVTLLLTKHRDTVMIFVLSGKFYSKILKRCFYIVNISAYKVSKLPYWP